MTSSTRTAEPGSIELELPYPPSVNHYYRNVVIWKDGRAMARTLISREGRKYRKAVEVHVMLKQLKPLQGPIALDIRIYPPDRRKRDLDNAQKALLDSMQHAGVFEDDSQVVKITAEKCGPVRGGRVCVRISEEGNE